MFTNVEVYFPVKFVEEVDDEHRQLAWEFFVGFKVEEIRHGELGLITDVDDSTINTLFVIDHNGKELLVPAQEEFILKMDEKKRLMTVQLPDGLLNLDEIEECQ